MRSQEEEKQFVKRIRQGDAEAEDEIVKYLHPSVFLNITRKLQGRPDDVELLVNDILMLVIEQMRGGKFDPERGKLRDYAGGIANNKTSKYFRQLRLDAKYLKITSTLPDIPLEHEGEELMEQQEVSDRLKKAVDGLAHKYREVLELRFYREMTIEDISATISLPKRRVSERIHYAIMLLRKELQADKDFSIFSFLLVICPWALHYGL